MNDPPHNITQRRQLPERSWNINWFKKNQELVYVKMAIIGFYNNKEIFAFPSLLVGVMRYQLYVFVCVCS